METPLVSILMTAYNREKYIGAAIESVLASTYTHFELIIVDDRSADATVRVAKSFADKDSRIKVYINEHNLGDYPNRNQAASYARGKYLKYLDSDDLLYPYGLEAFVGYMEQDEDTALGICFRKDIVTQPFPIILDPSQSFRYHFFKDGYMDCSPTATIIRRDAFEKLGGFSGKRMIGDFEFALKTAKQYKIMLLPPSLSFWRNHGDQEMVFGVKNNMYPALYHTVLKEQFDGLSDRVLTEAEKRTIFKRMARARRIESGKGFIKKLLFIKK